LDLRSFPTRRSSDLQPGTLGKLACIAATQLQRQGLLGGVVTQKARTVTVQYRTRGHHLGIQQCVPTDQPGKVAVVTVGPVHHRRHGEATGRAGAGGYWLGACYWCCHACLICCLICSFKIIFAVSLLQCSKRKTECSKVMGTITSRKKKDGSVSHTAPSRIMRNGVRVYQESQTLDRKPAAKAWMKKRETELAEPGALERAARPGTTLKQMIGQYLEQFEKVRPLGKTKRATLRAIADSWLGNVMDADLTSQKRVEYAARRSIADGCGVRPRPS